MDGIRDFETTNLGSHTKHTRSIKKLFSTSLDAVLCSLDMLRSADIQNHPRFGFGRPPLRAQFAPYYSRQYVLHMKVNPITILGAPAAVLITIVWESYQRTKPREGRGPRHYSAQDSIWLLTPVLIYAIFCVALVCDLPTPSGNGYNVIPLCAAYLVLGQVPVTIMYEFQFPSRSLRALASICTYVAACAALAIHWQLFLLGSSAGRDDLFNGPLPRYSKYPMLLLVAISTVDTLLAVTLSAIVVDLPYDQRHKIISLSWIGRTRTGRNVARPRAKTLLDGGTVRDASLHRVAWKCACGTQLHDLYLEKVPGYLRTLETRLGKESEATTRESHRGGSRLWVAALSRLTVRVATSDPTRGSTTTSGSAWADQKSPNYGKTGNEFSNFESSKSSSSISKSTRTYSSTAIRQGFPQISYLLLCIPEAWAGLRLHQQQLILSTTIKNDFELFQLLREVYASRRNHVTSALSLRTVNSVSFAHFLVDLSHYVDLKPHQSACQPSPTDCKCLPPQSMLFPATNAEYWCAPTQPECSPPIGTNYLTHCFQSPNCINLSSTWVLQQVPKRLTGQLMASSGGQPARGWGLAFEEGWNRDKIRNWLFGAFILGSFTFGILWSVLKRDVQSAFGISGYIVAVLASFLAYLGSAGPRMTLP